MEIKKRTDRVTKVTKDGEIQLPIAHYALINSEKRINNGAGKISIYGLGSCIALILYDIEKGIFAMSHILLPDAKFSKKLNPEDIPHKYATYSVKDLMSEMIIHGSKRKNLKAVIVGGSDLFKNNILEMGKENINAVKRQLELYNIRLEKEIVGGRRGRIVICDARRRSLSVKNTGDEKFNEIDLD